jgi:hypothetical protein
VSAIGNRPVLWQPHPGPQTTFLASSAYECLYGGAAGGGKSHALLFGALRQVDHPQYRALILRRTFPELRELMDQALPVFTSLGAGWNSSEKRFRFPSGAIVEFGYCTTYRDVLQYQGQAFQYIGFDELGQIAEERIWTYLISRNRPTAPGQKLQMRASANPGGPGHHWLNKRFVTPCPPDGTPVTMDGFSRAFVAARLKDNPTLMANDPAYGERLQLLPELERRWLADGDWNAGAGLALAIGKQHIQPAFEIPEHWTLFSALDWGYNHPFSWGLYAVNQDGSVYCVDTATGRHLQPPAIADRFKDILKGRPLQYTVAGHDVWADVKARSENIPTLAEQFAAHGFPMIKANISRVAGVQNLRRYLDGASPRFKLFDTPNNRAVFECLESRVSDPNHPEDVLKVDADAEGGGGDDHYDQVRYALASRPLAAKIAAPLANRPEDRARTFDFGTGAFKDTSVTLDKALGQKAPRNPHRVPSRNWRQG